MCTKFIYETNAIWKRVISMNFDNISLEIRNFRYSPGNENCIHQTHLCKRGIRTYMLICIVVSLNLTERRNKHDNNVQSFYMFPCSSNGMTNWMTLLSRIPLYFTLDFIVTRVPCIHLKLPSGTVTASKNKKYRNRS